MNRPISRLLLSVVMALFGLKAAKAEGGSLLGQNLNAVVKSADFFTFFNLAQVDQKQTGDRVVFMFKPTGPVFKPLTTVNVATDLSGRITGIELLLARSFVDDQRQGAFARDIAKSMLSSTLPDADRQTMSSLIDDIELRGPSQNVLRASSARATLSDSRSVAEGYDVILGEPKQFVRQLTESLVALENIPLGSDRWLRIVVNDKH